MILSGHVIRLVLHCYLFFISYILGRILGHILGHILGKFRKHACGFLFTIGVVWKSKYTVLYITDKKSINHTV
jgi:hypothetical protein